MELFKFTMCDNTTDHQDIRYTTMKIHSNPNYLSDDVKGSIWDPTKASNQGGDEGS